MEGQEKKVINGKEFLVKRDEEGKWIGHEPVEKEPGVMIGDYVCIRGGVSEEALKEAKEELLNNICKEIRGIAEQKPDEFFIIKKQMPVGPLGEECDTVACKLILPTVSSYGADE